MPVLAGTVPNIMTLDQIDIVLQRLPAWRGAQRVRVLEACVRRLGILRQANAIDAEMLKVYQGKVMLPLQRARQQQAITEQHAQLTE